MAAAATNSTVVVVYELGNLCRALYAVVLLLLLVYNATTRRTATSYESTTLRQRHNDEASLVRVRMMEDLCGVVVHSINSTLAELHR